MRNILVCIGVSLGMGFFAHCAYVSGSEVSKYSLYAIWILLVLNAHKILKDSGSDSSDDGSDPDIESDADGLDGNTETTTAEEVITES